MFIIAALALLDPLCSNAETGFFAMIPTAALREDLGPLQQCSGVPLGTVLRIRSGGAGKVPEQQFP